MEISPFNYKKNTCTSSIIAILIGHFFSLDGSVTTFKYNNKIYTIMYIYYFEIRKFRRRKFVQYHTLEKDQLQEVFHKLFH
jgi:hypothetical protein